MSADDPFAHSSQNEQDTRCYAHFARLPCLDPASVQEAHDMIRRAFELSEEFGLPVHLPPHDTDLPFERGRGAGPATRAAEGEFRKTPGNMS